MRNLMCAIRRDPGIVKEIGAEHVAVEWIRKEGGSESWIQCYRRPICGSDVEQLEVTSA